MGRDSHLDEESEEEIEAKKKEVVEDDDEESNDPAKPKRTKVGINTAEEKGVINTEISAEVKKAYLDYAMSVIVSRAIPAIEDGLKPVQRRILFSMHQMGLKPGTQTKKSARIVGDVIGKYHPHGDIAVYDAMVRMAQDFSLRYPLVFGQGNFGSLDGDPPAAYRYTEARLMPISMELLQDIEKETVNFVPNFDSSMKEPELLPGKVPSLMINGATGIAVGMATNIPPHNLTEVCDAIIEYVNKPDITIDQLCETVKGPDFPTGGLVFGDMNEIYKTGKGKLTMRGRITTEEKKGKEIIVITEIPYMVNKSTLVEQIANLIKDKKLKDIGDLRDESAKGKVRIVLELKKGVNSKFIINSLYKHSRLQDSFNVNFLALVDGQPRILNIRDVMVNYVEYRKKIITLKSKFDLKKAKDRLEIVEGLIKALKDIDEIINIIKRSREEAAENLMKKFGFTKRQAEAILETKLRQLTALEQDKLKKEHQELKEAIEKLENVLGDIKEVLKIVVKEIKEIKEKYGDNRRTQIMKRISEISEKDLVQEKGVVITITEKGYCKRIDLKSYKEQHRGGKGVIGSNLATDDFTKQLISCSTHDYLMFFTSRGRVLWLKAHEIPEAEKYSKGKALVNILSLKDETITNVISVKDFKDSLFMATKKGQVKKISLNVFSKPRASGVRAINLPPDNSDNLIGVEVVKGGQEIMLATKHGKAIKFDSKDVRPMGRSSYGVTGIKMEKGDAVVSLEVLGTKAILTITKNGYGKRTEVDEYRKTARAGKGVINLKCSDKTGHVVTTISVSDKDGAIITTAKGMVIRTNLDEIRVMGRAAQGVRIVKLQAGDSVSDMVRVGEEEVEIIEKKE